VNETPFTQNIGHARLSVLGLLDGCAYNPNDYYDPGAIEKLGFISEKMIARTEPARRGDPPPPILLPLPTTMVMLPTFPTAPAGRMNVYEYVVKVTPTESVSVFSEYPGFNVGDCVKVFLSQRASYPRIAHGSGCAK
jgi:hypothetical protein